jgi:hypothetical protein
VNLRRYSYTLLFALCATLISTVVPGSARVTYPDIMGCEFGCEVAAVGFPFPFIIDYPGISPGHSADLTGALLGVDQVNWGRAAATFSVWTVAGLFATYVTRRKRERRHYNVDFH